MEKKEWENSTICLNLKNCLSALNAKMITYNTFQGDDFKAMITLVDNRIAICTVADEKGNLMDTIDYDREV